MTLDKPTAVLLGMPISVLIAVGVVAAPMVTTSTTIGLLVFMLIIARRHELAGTYLQLFGLFLVAYAFLGRGFAHLGVPPLYVGEMLLLLGLAALTITGGLRRVWPSRLFLPLVSLLVLGAAATVPHLQQYGITAFRDAAIWGYGVFAILVASFTLKEDAVTRAIRIYGGWLPWFLIWVPIAMTVRRLVPSLIPMVPGTEIAIVSPKVGLIAVHLAAAMAYMVLNLRTFGSLGSGSSSQREWLWWLAWVFGCLTVFTGRAAILTVMSVMALVLLMRPISRWGKFIFLTCTFGIALVATDAEISFGSGRSVSTEGLALAVRSIFGDVGASAYDGSRSWRLAWWSDVLDYTLFGDYFWTGKGYGINLADDDGYQVLADGSLRSPHNGHLTFLARGGVPGALSWLILNVAFAVLFLRAYFRAKRLGQEEWAKLDLWILAYWLAFMVNGAFDVFLEGPPGGIWFWGLFGFGMAALEVQRRGTKPPATSTYT